MMVFAVMWLTVEVVILWALARRSAHFYQQLVPPAVFLAGLGLARLRRALAAAGLSDRKRACRWLLAGGATIVLAAAMPLAAQASRRAPTFDYRREVRDFETWLADWSPQSLADGSDGRASAPTRPLSREPL